MTMVAFESQGGLNCFGCGALVPKGLVVVTTGIYDWCPVCTQDVLPKHVERGKIDEALDKFWRENSGFTKGGVA